MAQSTVVGFFNSLDQAHRAADELERAGIPKNNIGLVAKDVHGSESAEADSGESSSDRDITVGKGAAVGGATGLLAALTALAIPGIGPVVAGGALATALTGAGVGVVSGGILGPLLDRGIPDEDARRYSEEVASGRTMVTVDAEDPQQAQRAQQLLDAAGVIDIEGPRTESAGGSTEVGRVSRPQQQETGSREGQTIPVVEEQLEVGKRPVTTSAVRVRSRVIEKPVSADVQLRQERVVVERRPVDREAQGDPAASGEREFEARETSEEPVVSKRPRVVEEVRVGKQTNQTTARVQDKVKRTDVDVKRTNPPRGAGTNSSGESPARR